MRLKSPIAVPAVIDLHVHLRQDPAMMALAIQGVRDGGTQTVYVMPNLIPPLTTIPNILSYHSRLRALAGQLPGCSNIEFLMTLYLHDDLTPKTIAAAAATSHAGTRIIQGVKAYPAGVTTNSTAGVTSFDKFYPLFAVMEEHDLILNIHGETPGADVLSAEADFLPTLKEIHARFPGLRIVLEHVSSTAALQAVRACGEKVRCTITAHHLHITQDDWAGHELGGDASHNWCKPAAKTDGDRAALVQAIVRSGKKVMFGSDSAPHPASAKSTSPPAAGCYTQPYTASLVLQALELGVQQGWIRAEEVTRGVLEGFLSQNAEEWLRPQRRTPSPGNWPLLRMARKGERVPEQVKGEADGETVEVVPFGAGKQCWSVEWVGSDARGDRQKLEWED